MDPGLGLLLQSLCILAIAGGHIRRDDDSAVSQFIFWPYMHEEPLLVDRTNSLDRPLDEFRDELNHCVNLIIERYQTMYDANAHPGIPEHTVREWFDEPLPQTAMDFDVLLNMIDNTVIAHPTMNLGTKMFAYVMSGGNQVSVMADLLASALNQNVAKWHLAPSMTEIERRVIAWTAEFIGLAHHNGGVIVSGGSAANLTGLTVARNLFAEKSNVRAKGLFALPPLIVYGSDQSHASIEKSIELLGLGSAHLHRIRTNDDYTIDLDALAKQITTDKRVGYTPFCLIGNAGTVNTGAIDPLDELAAIAHEHSMWLHVDGAYGGLAASIGDKRGLYKGLAMADSIALDYHKWLYQPFEIGCTLVKDWDALKRTYYKSAEYLDYGAHEKRFDVSSHHFDLSRNAKAFKVWMSFKAYGAEQFAAMIDKDIAAADYLATRIREAKDFELVSSGELAIVCFRYIRQGSLDETSLDRLNAQLLEALERDGRLFITGTKLKGRQVIRACIINHRIQNADIDVMLEIIRDLAGTLQHP